MGPAGSLQVREDRFLYRRSLGHLRRRGTWRGVLRGVARRREWDPEFHVMLVHVSGTRGLTGRHRAISGR